MANDAAAQPINADLSGRLADNVIHFGRVLRKAGMPVGPGKVIDAIRAVEAVGIRKKDDFYWALHSVFVNRYEHREIFNQAFHIVWRKPNLLAELQNVQLPALAPPDNVKKANRRVSEAVVAERGDRDKTEQEKKEVELDASFTYSDKEVLQKADFESMSIEEQARAKDAIKRMRLPIAEVATRRFVSDARGPRIDMRRSFRSGLRFGGSLIALKRKSRRKRRPPIVILCDISGSMSNYSRMFLHFVHALTNDRDRVHTFLFGTRLTNVTRYLKQRDVDIAIAKVRDVVEDWSGGTRIGRTLREFNHVWSRRVLGQGAVVILMTDGLDRDAGAGLESEIERLHKSCRRLIWLNPLLRFKEFEAKSSGVRVIIRHVDDFRPVHNLESLADLAAALMSQSKEPSTVDAYLPDETPELAHNEMRMI
ncbi:MAG: VWA domain-containing protein [Alphaproteobacteria bacterium]|nr:VWA domain-containing protein [Alphaproteobacteria bacterium]